MLVGFIFGLSEVSVEAVNPLNNGTLPPSTFESGLVNRPASRYYSGNLGVTGNIGGGRYFQGIVPYSATSYFSESLGTTSLDSFLRRSARFQRYGDYRNINEPFYWSTRAVSPARIDPESMLVEPRQFKSRIPRRNIYGLDTRVDSRELLVPETPLIPRGIFKVDLPGFSGQYQKPGRLENLTKYPRTWMQAELFKRKDERKGKSELYKGDFPVQKSDLEQLLEAARGERERNQYRVESKESSLAFDGRNPYPKSVQVIQEAGKVDEGVSFDRFSDRSRYLLDQQRRSSEEEREESHPGKEELQDMLGRKISDLFPSSDDSGVVPEAAGQSETDILLEKRIEAELQLGRNFGERREFVVQDGISEILSKQQISSEKEIYRRIKEQLKLLGVDTSELGLSGAEASSSKGLTSKGPLGENYSIQAESIMGSEHDYASFSRAKFKEQLTLGESLLKEGKYYSAVDAYTMALVYEAGNPLANGGKGHALFSAGEYMSSALFITRSLESFDKYDKKLSDEQRTFKSSALSRLALLSASFTLIDRDTLESRIKDIHEWQQQSDSAELEFLLGYIYYQMGKIDIAKDILLQSRERMPESVSVSTVLNAIDSVKKSGSGSTK